MISKIKQKMQVFFGGQRSNNFDMTTLKNDDLSDKERNDEINRKGSSHLALVDKIAYVKREEDDGKIKNRIVKVNNETMAATYVFKEKYIESDAFFSMYPMGGIVNIAINQRHPLYDYVKIIFEECVERDREKRKAQDAIMFMLLSWAQYESELPEGRLKEKAEETRKDWGRIASRLNCE